MHTTLHVSLEGQSHHYPLHIGQGILSNLPAYMADVGLIDGTRCFIVTDSGVPIRYVETVGAVLEQAGYPVTVATVMQGEGAKSIAVLEELYAKAMAVGMNRSSVFIALGGGIPGDLTGFLAATYYRGARFVQVPTTLLAQVDSSVGGKVAVNFGDVKNCIGAFKQPDVVCMDLEVLQSLSPSQYAAGLAELFKYALIERSALAVEPHSVEASPLNMPWMLERFEGLETGWKTELSTLVEHACRIKAAVVIRDEHEQATTFDATGRVCLNLGHTFGHAYEATLGYNTVLHGHAVAMGMVCSVFAQADVLGDVTVSRVLNLIHELGLIPYDVLATLPEWPSPEALLQVMAKDKKNMDASRIRLILPVLPLGQVVVQERSARQLIPSIVKAHEYFRHQLEALMANPIPQL
jgi:3-dehydroquinate synthase